MPSRVENSSQVPFISSLPITSSGISFPICSQKGTLSEQLMITPCGSVMKTWFPVAPEMELIIMLSVQSLMESVRAMAEAAWATSSVLAIMSRR